jgi:hypothetical protein
MAWQLAAETCWGNWMTIIKNREISYMKYENGRLIGLVTSYAETAF